MRPRRSSSPLSLVSAPRRALAGLLAALVLALTLLQVSPEAHEFIHHHGGDEHDHAGAACTHALDDHAHEAAATPVNDDDHTCAVVLFAQGVALPLALPHLAAPSLVARPLDAATPLALFLSSPRYLRQPERGPPVI